MISLKQYLQQIEDYKVGEVNKVECVGCGKFHSHVLSCGECWFRILSSEKDKASMGTSMKPIYDALIELNIDEIAEKELLSDE